MNTNLFFLGGFCKPEIFKKKIYPEFLGYFPEIRKIECNWIYIIEVENEEKNSRKKIFLSIKNLLSLGSVDVYDGNRFIKNQVLVFFLFFQERVLNHRGPPRHKIF
jgi:hypothetical protein